VDGPAPGRAAARPPASADRTLAIAREIGDRSLESQALNGLGETLRAIGRAPEAAARHAAALGLARETGDRHEEARSHDGLAAAFGDPTAAREHHEQAMAIYTDLEVPEAAASPAATRTQAGADRAFGVERA
jgi:hypothetical protein